MRTVYTVEVFDPRSKKYKAVGKGLKVVKACDLMVAHSGTRRRMRSGDLIVARREV